MSTDWKARAEKAEAELKELRSAAASGNAWKAEVERLRAALACNDCAFHRADVGRLCPDHHRD